MPNSSGVPLFIITHFTLPQVGLDFQEIDPLDLPAEPSQKLPGRHYLRFVSLTRSSLYRTVSLLAPADLTLVRGMLGLPVFDVFDERLE